MTELLSKLLKGESLSRSQAYEIMDQLCQGTCTPEQASAVLIALKMKSEAVEEIVGFVQCLKAKALPVSSPKDNLMDVCGTGGDSLGTFNVSTTVAFVVAASGQPIAKHGNRSVSSRSGSFDVLEALGLTFSSDPVKINHSIERFGLGFLFAPAFHPVLKQLSVLRKSLGVATIFNILGPLLNPIPVKRQVIGVYDKKFLDKIALSLNEMGAQEAMVVHGADGLDEFSISGPTFVTHLKDKKIFNLMVTPEDMGLRSHPLQEIKGGSAQDNAKILTSILAGEKGAKRDTVVLNAAAALVVGGIAGDFKEGVRRAQEAIDSGKALSILKEMRALP